MPGMTALSTAGVPSALTSCFDSVVRNPAVAGPNPTQTMSTSMRWRSTADGVGSVTGRLMTNATNKGNQFREHLRSESCKPCSRNPAVAGLRSGTVTNTHGAT